jgi:hypothetical protein
LKVPFEGAEKEARRGQALHVLQELALTPFEAAHEIT